MQHLWSWVRRKHLRLVLSGVLRFSPFSSSVYFVSHRHKSVPLMLRFSYLHQVRCRIYWNQMRCLRHRIYRNQLCGLQPRLLPYQQPLLLMHSHQSSLHLLLRLHCLLNLCGWLQRTNLQHMHTGILRFVSYSFHMYSMLSHHHPLRSVFDLFHLLDVLQRFRWFSLRPLRCRLWWNQLWYLPYWVLLFIGSMPFLHSYQSTLYFMQRLSVLLNVRNWL